MSLCVRVHVCSHGLIALQILLPHMHTDCMQLLVTGGQPICTCTCTKLSPLTAALLGTDSHFIHGRFYFFSDGKGSPEKKNKALDGSWNIRSPLVPGIGNCINSEQG